MTVPIPPFLREVARKQGVREERIDDLWERHKSHCAEVNRAELQWDTTILNAGTAMPTYQATALGQLADKRIIAR